MYRYDTTLDTYTKVAPMQEPHMRVKAVTLGAHQIFYGAANSAVQRGAVQVRH